MNVIPANKLTSAINSVAKAGAKFSIQLHNVAYSCLAHIDASGDVRPLQRLLDTIGGKVTKGAIVEWAKRFGRVKVEYAEDDTAKASPLFKYAKGKESDLEGAALIAPMDFKAEGAGNKAEFDLAAKLTAVVKAASKEGVTLTADELRALKLVTEALGIINPEVAPKSNVTPIKAPKKTKAQKQAALAQTLESEAA